MRKRMDLSPTNSLLLLCKENEDTSFDQQLEEMDEFASIADDDECIQMLMDREITSCGLQISSYDDDDWIQTARLDGINYILTIRESLGFRFQTAYLSVTYLDMFLSRRSIDKEKCWAIRLLSIACLSLAAKMEECIVPPLSDFCLNEFYNFESNVIQRMELLLLNTLDWRLRSITPFAYIHFFMKKLSENSAPVNGLSRSVNLILGSMRDMKIMCHKPSVVAAAATLVVLDQRLTKDALQLKIASMSCPINSKDVICCYYKVKELEMERLKLEECIIKSPTEAGVNNSNTKSKKRLIFDHLGDISEKKKLKHL